MADLNIWQKRPRSWIIAAVALFTGICAFWAADRLIDDDTGAGAIEGASTSGRGTSVTIPVPSPVRDYLHFSASAGDERTDSPGVEHEDMADGLRKLAGALGALGVGGADLPIDLRVAAEHLLLNPASTENAATVRSLLIDAADAIGAERHERTAILRRSAEAVQAETALPDQQASMYQFFREAAGAIEYLAEERAVPGRPGRPGR